MSELFTPIKMRGETAKNKVFVAPMCQYSVEKTDGIPTDWHMVHLGTRAVGGAGLVMVEASAVSPEGRISPQDVGIWADRHANAFEPIIAFMLSQGTLPAIQLAHAGRKASHFRPWDEGEVLLAENGGWDIVGPSSIPFEKDWVTPEQLAIEDLDGIVADFTAAASRSVDAGFKVIELHLAHGYLACEFMSPLSNKRSDDYGGSLSNRCRFPLEIVSAVRKVIPDSMPLLARISATEYMEAGWSLSDSVELAGWMKDEGVDMIDCSSGGNSPDQDLDPFPGYQVPFASRIRKEVGIQTGAVGLITDASQAEQTLRNGDADAIFLGRELLRNPYWPLYARDELDSSDDLWPRQYVRAR
jgi:2,4-dienoyl-CoA reductase-like NADH-dependent reductase (Old Yellow Enzyme family)